MRYRLLIFTVSSFLFFGCGNEKKKEFSLEFSNTNYIKVDSVTASKEDSKIETIVNPYREHVDSMMNQELGTTDFEIFKNQPNGGLNNLSADMVYEISKQIFTEEASKPDICLLNYGGLRYPLPKGKITLANMYQLMPFENEIVLLKLRGSQVDSLFEYIAQTNGQPVAGCILTVKNNHSVKAEINGKPFDSSKAYNVVTSDYLADGGDKMSFFKNPLDKIKTGMLIRNAMIEYIKQKTSKGEIIKRNLEERIKIQN